MAIAVAVSCAVITVLINGVLGLWWYMRCKRGKKVNVLSIFFSFSFLWNGQMETEAFENVENRICTVAFIYIFDVLSWTTDEHGSIGILFQ